MIRYARHMHTWVSVRIARTHTHTYMHACMHACMHAYILIHLSMHAHIHMYCKCTCVYTCTVNAHVYTLFVGVMVYWNVDECLCVVQRMWNMTVCDSKMKVAINNWLNPFPMIQGGDCCDLAYSWAISMECSSLWIDSFGGLSLNFAS